MVFQNPVGGRPTTFPQLEQQEEKPILTHEAVFKMKTFLGISKNKCLKMVRALTGMYKTFLCPHHFMFLPFLKNV